MKNNFSPIITEIFVSVCGSDETGDGSIAKPYATVTAAQTAVRKLLRENTSAGEIRVCFRGGTYYIRNSIVIGNDDWSETVRVIYTAYEKEDVRLVGGVPVTGWENEGGGIFSAELPVSGDFWVMYGDGVRLTPAREVNWQSVEVRDPSHLQAAAGGPSSWFGEILKVTELSGGEIKTMYPKCAWSGPVQYLQGAREYISVPGEWAIEENRVYYMPADSDALGNSEIIAGTAENIFSICGRPDVPVKNIVISGLRLEMNAFGENLAAHARANNVTAEYDENLTGLVCIRNAENITVEHCRMSNGGYMGVVLREYAQHNTIHCNEIRNTGYAGMFLIGENPGSLNYCSRYNVISGNRIFNVGEFVGHGAGIYLMNSGENRIIHNEISNVPRYGISMKGIRYGVFGDNGITVDFDDHWKYNQTTGNYIGYNRIFNTGIRSGDGGGIEGWGIGRDNHIDHNIIYNAYRGVPTTGWRGHSIFLDDAAHYVKVTCNIIYDENAVAVNAGIFIKSIGNYVVNNVFDVGYAKNGAADIAPYICPAGGSVFCRNIVYSAAPGELHDDGTLTESDSGDRVMLYFTDSANSSGTSCYVSLDEMNYNLYYNASGRAYFRVENDLLSLDEWKICPRNILGYDTDSIQDDPMFYDARNHDYRLSAGSPAFALGIESIDTARIGLPDEYRYLKELPQEDRFMDRKIRIGIHGCGRGQDFIRILGLLTDKAEIVALCDNRERTLHRAKELCTDNPQLFTDFDDFIRCDMDGVLLCNFFHEHVPCAVKALEKGIAVLSETTAAGTLAECVQLVRAVEKTVGKYMLAENYPFFCANQEIKRIYDTGNLGRVLYAEGEYCHPMSRDELNYAAETPDHWRAWLPKSYYLTHALGPLMYITGETPVTVNCRTVFAPELFEGTDRQSADAVSVMLSQTESGALFRFTGTASYAPHGDWYRIAGTKGGAETLRGDETGVRVAYNWWNVPDGEEADRVYHPTWSEDRDLAEKAGHNGGDYWVIRHFLSYITDDIPPFFDVYRAVTMSAVGILAWRSSFENGKEYRIPDFRREEDRLLYEADDASPFPGAKNQCVPPCSQPYNPELTKNSDN